MDDELIDAIDKHGFVFWVCPNGCHGIVKWNIPKTEAVCMECGTKSTSPKSKTCPKGSGCGKTLPATLDYFYRDCTRVDKLSNYCRECMKKKGRDNYRRNPMHKRSLRYVLMRLNEPRYHNLIRMMFQVAQREHKTSEEAAQWLGMKTGTFEILCQKYLPVDIEEKCVHEMIKATCSFCK